MSMKILAKSIVVGKDMRSIKLYRFRNGQHEINPPSQMQRMEHRNSGAPSIAPSYAVPEVHRHITWRQA
jgi:hypothetical protein